MYSQTISDVLVFRTNIQRSHAEEISSVLNREERIQHWSIDYSDVDKVLRIQSHQITTHDVIALVNKIGFSCEELPD